MQTQANTGCVSSQSASSRSNLWTLDGDIDQEEEDQDSGVLRQQEETLTSAKQPSKYDDWRSATFFSVLLSLFLCTLLIET